MSGDSPHVHFLTQSEHDPATRFRAAAYLPGLREAGFEISWDVIPAAGKERRRVLEMQAERDVTLVQRRLFNLRDQSRLRDNARLLVFDFDDSIMFKDGGRSSMTRSGRFSRMIRGADLVLAGNEYLRDAARKYSKAVHVLPTVLDCDTYVPSPDGDPEGSLRIGWIGSRSTLPYLLERLPQITVAASRLRERGIRAELEVVCDEHEGLAEEVDGLVVHRTVWSEAVELPALHRFDLGLMPLPDDPWTRGKCGFKLLQYLATGTAAVADPVGVNATILAPGRGAPESGIAEVGGVLAGTPEEWIEALVELGSDPERRRRAAERGRERVVKEYSLAFALPELASHLRRLIERAAR